MICNLLILIYIYACELIGLHNYLQKTKYVNG